MHNKLLSVAVAILFVFAIVESIYITGVLNSTHSALCKSYVNLVNDRNESAQFLIDHPHPGAIAGLTEKQVISTTRARIHRQTETINAQAGLGCAAPPLIGGK